MLRLSKKLFEFRFIRICQKMSLSGQNDDVLFNVVKENNAVITLNRPKSLNALDTSMIEKIFPQLREWQKKQNVNMVIIKGAGDKAFCAGGDIRAISDPTREDVQKTFFKGEYNLNYAIGTSNIPWVALLNGITMGGGVGLSVHGHFRIATEKTLFAMPETAIGLYPDVGGSYFLPRLSNHLGYYLGLTGARLKGVDVYYAGIATHYVKSDQIDSLENELLSLKSAQKDDIQKVLLEFHDKSKPDQERFSLSEYIAKIDHIFSMDSVGDIIEALKLEESDWSKNTIELFNKVSPTSLKITLEQLKRGRKVKNLKEALQMENRLSLRVMKGSDFYEGVRSVLIDKDQSPKWQPSRLEDVSDAQVLDLFEPLPKDLELELY